MGELITKINKFQNRKLIDEEGVKKLGLVKSPFLNTELMSDKTISDVVEALIGVYLLVMAAMINDDSRLETIIYI